MDFGTGFYTTTNKAQAISFSEKVTTRRKCGKPEVSIYDFDKNKAFAECSVLRFNSANEAWLDFVSENRVGKYKGKKYDIVFGPVANDNVYTTFALYASGLLSKEQTIETLKVKKLYNQIVFASEKSLSYLKFLGFVSQKD